MTYPELQDRIDNHIKYITHWLVLTLPQLGKRKDTGPLTDSDFFKHLLREKDAIKLRSEGQIVGVVTENPSPHVPPFPGKKNAHMVLWWAIKQDEQKPYDRCDFNQMTDQDPKTQNDWALVSAEGIRQAVIRIVTKAGRHRNEVVPYIVVHGLTGHATPDERKQGDTNRGSQSSAHGHLNVYYHGPLNRLEPQMITSDLITNREKTKQIGAVDSFVFDKLGKIVATWLGKQYPNLRVETKRDHTVKEHRLSFHDGISFTYESPVTIKDALMDVLAIQKHLKDTYIVARNLNYSYYQVKGEEDAENIFLQQAHSYLSHCYGSAIAESIMDLVVYFKPTRAQLEQLVRESTPGTNNHTFLSDQLQQYKELESILTDNREKDGFVKNYASRHNIDPESAKIMAEYLYDMVRGDYESNWRQIEYVFTKHYSSSYKLDVVIDARTGELKVGSFSIAPRFATHRGGAEDILGVIVRRQENK